MGYERRRMDETVPYDNCRVCSRKIPVDHKWCDRHDPNELMDEDDDYDPTPCCYQHGVGAISSTEPCPEIADND